MKELRPSRPWTRALLNDGGIKWRWFSKLFVNDDTCDQSSAEDNQRRQDDKNNFPEAHQVTSASFTEASTVSSKSGAALIAACPESGKKAQAPNKRATN